MDIKGIRDFKQQLAVMKKDLQALIDSPNEHHPHANILIHVRDLAYSSGTGPLVSINDSKTYDLVEKAIQQMLPQILAKAIQIGDKEYRDTIIDFKKQAQDLLQEIKDAEKAWYN